MSQDILLRSIHNPNRLVVEHARVNCRLFFFSPRVLSDWNKLDIDLNTCCSVRSFKTLLDGSDFDNDTIRCSSFSFIFVFCANL